MISLICWWYLSLEWTDNWPCSNISISRWGSQRATRKWLDYEGLRWHVSLPCLEWLIPTVTLMRSRITWETGHWALSEVSWEDLPTLAGTILWAVVLDCINWTKRAEHKRSSLSISLCISFFFVFYGYKAFSYFETLMWLPYKRPPKGSGTIRRYGLVGRNVSL